MHVIKVLKTHEDGSQLAIIEPSKLGEVIYEITKDTPGYHSRFYKVYDKVEVPNIPKGTQGQLMACEPDIYAEVAILRLTVQGVEYTTFVPLDCVEHVSGNMGPRVDDAEEE